MKDWRNDKVTDKQLNYIHEMCEHSAYEIEEFKGTTKGEAHDYIETWSGLAHESVWAVENGYD